jgi:glycosyltransferase involved in cell wall biosynthesis
MRHRYALIIPALNEEGSMGALLEQVPRDLLAQILVVDNGSRDRTAEVARAAGAQVIPEPRQGYGQACLTGLAHLREDITAVAFMDADLSDDPADLARFLRRFDEGHWDLLVGSRVLGQAEPGSLTPVQRFGNWLTTRLLHWLWGAAFSDLGPLRVVNRAALERLAMRDTNYGWTVEMQAKAAKWKLRVKELPVHYRRRRIGRSKVSGTLWGSVRAGVKILWTVLRCWRIK